MADHRSSNSAGGSSVSSPGVPPENPGSSGSRKPQTPMKSQKLDRTLQELECAFSDWESLSSTKVRQAMIEDDRRKAQEASKGEYELVEKTKKLLCQLREQLAELND